MNLALPALIILLALLPGIAAFYGYFGGRFDKRTAGVSGVEEVALYVALAIPVDVAARWTCQHWLGYDLNFPVALALLTGGSLSEAQTTPITLAFRDWSGVTTLVYLTVLAGGYTIGSLARRFVWACRLDTVFSFFRLRHEWFYVLQARVRGNRRIVMAWVDVLTEHPGEGEERSRLYRGLVSDFEISGDGALASLTLSDATRGKGRGEKFEWKPIPSDRITLMGSTIHSINVTYVQVDDMPSDAWPRFRHRVRAWFRSFIFEEP